MNPRPHGAPASSRFAVRDRFDRPTVRAFGIASLARGGYAAAGTFLRDSFRAAHFAPSPIRIRRKLDDARLLGRSL